MKDFLFKHKGLWRTLLAVFTFVFVFAFTLGNVLEQYSGQVNKQLGTVTSKVVSDDDTDLYDIYTPEYATSDELKEEHLKVGAQVGAEGSVLLQNENGALPLDVKEKITLFGSASTLSNGFFGMQYGATVTASQNVSLYDALTGRGAAVNPEMNEYNETQAATIPGASNSFTPGFTGTTTENGYDPFEFEPDTSLVGGYDDVGIVVIGRGSAESADYFPGTLGIDPSYGARNVLAFTDAEKDVVKAAKASCKKVVVLANSCNPMELGPLMSGGECEADAILWIGFLGNYGYYGIADVLLGNENPSGRLVDTYAYDTTSSPAMQNFGIYRFGNIDSYYVANGGTIEENDRADYYLVEPESIYTGYKYYETRYEDAVLGQGNAAPDAGSFDSQGTWSYGEEASYSCGEGLSYTTFSQKIASVEWPEDALEPGDDVTATVSVEVTNTGDVAGMSVVQVYGQSPYTDYDKANGVEKASVQLLNYAKTGVIEPKDSVTISIDVDMQLLASYDAEGAGTYIMEAGEDYYFALGCNEAREGAHAAVNNILAAKGYGPSDGMDSEGDKDATWKFSWDESYEDLFSVSKEGVTVENELQDADLNYWMENTVTYLSRSDWEWKDADGKSLWNTSDWSDANRKGYTGIDATDDMIYFLGNDTYEIDRSGEGVDEDLFDRDNGYTFADMIDENGNVLPYDSEEWNLLLDELNLSEAIEFVALGERTYSELTSIGFLGGYLAENGPTGVGLTISSYTSEAYWHDPKDPNSSYRWDDVGCALLQAATFDKSLLEEIGKMWGNDALYTGMAVIWGPSINSHRTPYNGRIAEYYSEDSVLSGYCASNVGKGASKFGLIVTAKHFAFNDQESNRNGVAPFFDEQKARENDLRGFQIAIEGGVKAVMTAFNRVGCTYSSAHAGLISGILRGEWDFCGYAISDMVNPAQYMTFTESVIAGTSTFDNSEISEYWGATSADGLAAMYSGDAKMLQAIKDAVHADLWTFANSNMANYVSGETMWVSNWWRDLYIILECSAGVIAGASLVLYIGCKAWDRKKKEVA